MSITTAYQSPKNYEIKGSIRTEQVQFITLSASAVSSNPKNAHADCVKQVEDALTEFQTDLFYSHPDTLFAVQAGKMHAITSAKRVVLRKMYNVSVLVKVAVRANERFAPNSLPLGEGMVFQS